MRENKLRELLENGNPSLGTRILSTWPTLLEVIGHCGQVDYIEFSGEYAPYNLVDLDNMARASELFEISTMIKVDQSAQRFLAQRALGSGFQNILFTDIRTVEDAKKCVRAVRAETPETRGLNPCAMRRNYLPDKHGTPEFVQAMEDTVIALMIEKGSAIENLEEILSLEGVDMVQFGPCDYAMSIGLPGEKEHPKVKDAERKMIETALEMNIHPRVEVSSVEQAREYLELGVRHFCIGTDIEIIHDWLKENGGKLRRQLSNISS